MSTDGAYQRDVLGRVTKTTLPDGREISYDYNTAGDLTHVSAPGRPANVFGFTLTGARTSWQAPQAADAGDTTAYRYDLDGDIASITRPDASTIDITRDGAGRVTQVSHPTATVTLRYAGAAGQLDRVTHSGGQALTWTHDGDLPMTETASGAVAGETRHAFDGEGRLTSSTVTATDAVTYAYDTGGLPSRGGALDITRSAATGFMSATTLGDSTSSHTYDSYGDPATLTYKQASSGVFSEGYVRDRGARITQRSETIAGQTHQFAYTYDAAGRLAEVKRDGTVQSTYGYDPNGNRTSEQQTGQAAISADFDTQDRLTHRDHTTYRYTANGDLREKTDDDSADTTSYSYDASGSLRTVDLPDGRHLRYLIDGLGRRVGREVDGQLQQGFLYGDGPRPSAELTSTGAIRSRFVYVTRSTVPDYMIRAGHTYRLVTDHQHSPRLIIDTQTGEIAQRIDYDAFGRVLTDSNPGFQPFGYAGGLYDPDTGLVRFGARDYDPQTGRWTTKDPIDYAGGDSNLYGYVFSDPINHTDPSGLEAWWMRASNAAAGELNVLSLGLSNQIAGAALGFNPACADFGQGYGTGQIAGGIALLATGIAGIRAGGAAAKAGKAAEEAATAPTRITGYAVGRDGSRHGLHQAISRDGGRGVSPQAMLDAVRSAQPEYQAARGTWKYAGDDAVVVLNSRGQVVTTWSRGSQGWRNQP